MDKIDHPSGIKQMMLNKRESSCSSPSACSLMDARWKCNGCGGLNMLDEGYCFWCGKDTANRTTTTPGKPAEEKH
jgi:hypothetical protein